MTYLSFWLLILCFLLSGRLLLLGDTLRTGIDWSWTGKSSAWSSSKFKLSNGFTLTGFCLSWDWGWERWLKLNMFASLTSFQCKLMSVWSLSQLRLCSVGTIWIASSKQQIARQAFWDWAGLCLLSHGCVFETTFGLRFWANGCIERWLNWLISWLFLFECEECLLK